MNPSAPRLRQRARSPTAAELINIPWLAVISEADRQEAAAALQVVSAETGERVCRTGAPSTFWFGVIDGLLKMSNVSLEGHQITYTGLPVAVFWRLLERSIPFNRFVMNQLNERLGQFIAAREIDRANQPDARVARSLAALFHPVLYPGVGQLLRITQQELAYLVGLSRQRVNSALNALQADRLIRVEYGGVRVLNLVGLRNHSVD